MWALAVSGRLHVVPKEVGVVGFGFSFSPSKTSCFSPTLGDSRLLPYQGSNRWFRWVLHLQIKCLGSGGVEIRSTKIPQL